MSWVLYEDDCFNVFPEIEDKSIDMILCDLPYGTTACKWDTPLPLDDLWLEYKRIIKDNGAIVLTASQPFTTTLIHSNIEMFRYNVVWDKIRKTRHLLAKKMPLKRHEDICIFSKEPPTYNPQMIKGTPHVRGPWGTEKEKGHGYGIVENRQYISDEYYPDDIIKFRQVLTAAHPTQKPVALFEYLIKTYTNENDLVLDNCAGSGTTGVACQNLNRNCILIEKEHDYCDIIRERMATAETLQVEQRKQQTLLDYAVAK
jgi:site-specific DNA-methyltransferase (adenine-specific)